MQRNPLNSAIVAAVVALSACGGGKSNSERADDFASRASALYDIAPDIPNCQPGTLSDSQKQVVINTLNDIRRLHGLGPVIYDYDSDDEVMRASLMFAANGAIEHTPPPSWKCFSTLGAQGAGSSNITGGVTSPYLAFESVESNIISWLTDVNNVVANNVGHRRWLLNPFLHKIAYGRVAGKLDSNNSTDGSAIKVIYNTDSTGGVASSAFIAYPIGDYPAKYFARGAILSFSAISSLSNMWANQNVNFSSSTVSIVRRGGPSVQVSNAAFDITGYGLPNNLQFAASSIDFNIYYDVSIRGVAIDGVLQDFSYWFRIVQ